MQPWGRALEKLRGKGQPNELSIAELSRRVKRKRNQYTAMCRSPLGPSIENLGRYLKAMNKTWAQWAEVYEPLAGKKKLVVRQLKVVPIDSSADGEGTTKGGGSRT